MAAVERRVLRIHPGEKDFWYSVARSNNCPEIEETDKVDPGQYLVFVEVVNQETTPDWLSLFRQAPTDSARLAIIARILKLQ